MSQATELGGYSLFSDTCFPAIDAFGFENKEISLFSLGRHCLRAVYLTLVPDRVLMPQYTCHSVKTVAKDLGMEISYYNLDEGFIPRIRNGKSGDVSLINNYFGLTAFTSAWSTFLENSITSHWIVDNTQSLCASNQFERHWSFISPRKFLPVTDGGILFSPEDGALKVAAIPESTDTSWSRIPWLFRAIDENGRKSSYPEYLSYRQHEVQAIEYARMSNVTKYLLQIYDVDSVIRVRNRLFSLLRSAVPIHPQFDCLLTMKDACPIGYPIKVKSAAKAQASFAKQSIYCARFWPELAHSPDLNSFERYILESTLMLPLSGEFSEQNVAMILEEISAEA